jgi:hypothetical protein
MKVFAFSSSNALIGKFNVDHLGDVIAGAEQLSATRPFRPYDYLECSGRSWTYVPGENGLELREGRINRPESDVSQPGVAAVPSGLLSRPESLIRRYRAGYRTSDSAVAFSEIIKNIGLAIGGVILFGGLLAAFIAKGAASFIIFLYTAGLAVFVTVVFLFFSVMVAAVGQMLRASLDTAVHTSPFLDEQQKSSAMELDPGQHSA